MADARALLRATRAASRVSHQHAQYTESGKLQCALCKLPIKPESAWTAHVRSADHMKRSLRAAEPHMGVRKRKASTADEVEVESDGHKRLRGTTPNGTESSETSEPGTEHVAVEVHNTSSASGQQAAVEDDDPEWVALQQLIRAPDPPGVGTAGTRSGATISAKPVTAEEIAAQAREEQSQQRDRRAAEMEAEEEDAELAMLEEFDEMDSLQRRVRRLKEMREQLRAGAGTGNREAIAPSPDEIGRARAEAVISATARPDAAKQNTTDELPAETAAESNDDDDDDDDAWGFRGS